MKSIYTRQAKQLIDVIRKERDNRWALLNAAVATKNYQALSEYAQTQQQDIHMLAIAQVDLFYKAMRLGLSYEEFADAVSIVVPFANPRKEN